MFGTSVKTMTSTVALLAGGWWIERPIFGHRWDGQILSFSVLMTTVWRSLTVRVRSERRSLEVAVNLPDGRVIAYTA